MNNELALFTCEQLLRELFNRKTFVGAVVYSPEENKFPHFIHKEVKVLSTVNIESTVKMMEVGIEAVRELEEGKK